MRKVKFRYIQYVISKNDIFLQIKYNITQFFITVPHILIIAQLQK